MDKKVAIVAKSDRMRHILDTIEGIKDSDVNMFLTGETGVGKSLIAKIIHSTSRRQNRPFFSINCATLSEELLVSELFGHEKGAFTGAVATKHGLVEIADSGTLFLDEISELSPQLQAKLLKAVEEGEFYRVGGTKPVRVDVRFLAATNQNVSHLIAKGKFREDLYYRSRRMGNGSHTLLTSRIPIKSLFSPSRLHPPARRCPSPAVGNHGGAATVRNSSTLIPKEK